MHLRKQKKPNGRVYLSIVQSYRTADGKPRSKTVSSLGYLDDLEDEYADPLAHFQQVVEEMNRQRKDDDEQTAATIAFPPNARIPFGLGGTVEAGAAAVIATLHRDLHIGQALQECCGEFGNSIDLERIVELFVWHRIAHPGRVADAWARRTCIPGMADLTVDDLFAGLDALGANVAAIRERVNAALGERRRATGKQDAFCFVTNHYVEGSRYDSPDFGRGWQSRPNPIVQIAVVTDETGIPLDYNVFDANLASTLSSFPAIQELAERHSGERFVVVANKAVGSSGDELVPLIDLDYGFAVLQSLRKGPRASREWVLDGAGYETFDGGRARCKERMGIRSIDPAKNLRHTDSLAVKEVALWQRDTFESTRFNRFRVVRRNEDIFANGAPSAGAVRPMRAMYGQGDAKPGAVDDHVWQVYWEKVAIDESMDGYRDIITSELDLSTRDVILLHRNLDAMSAFFSPEMGEWGDCPLRLPRKRYIQAYFLVCYLAACAVQLLYERAGQRFPGESLRGTLACLNGCDVGSGQFFFGFRSHLSDAIAEASGVDFSRPLVSGAELARTMRRVREE